MAEHTTHHPEDGEGLWVRSEVLPDGSYGICLTAGPDHAWTLDRDAAITHAVACVARATEAEHDTATLGLLVHTGAPRHAAAALIVEDLRPDRPDEHTATAPLAFRVGVGHAKHPRPDAGAWIPVIIMELDGQEMGQLTPADLRGHATGILSILAAVDLDTALHRVLVQRVGLDDDTARAVVDDLAHHWPHQPDLARTGASAAEETTQ